MGQQSWNIRPPRSILTFADLVKYLFVLGRVILDAGGDNEVSKEDEALGRGVFTTTSLKGLQGLADSDEAGLITVDEAYGYVSRRVPEATAQEQQPERKGTVEGQLVFGVKQ